MRTTILGFLTAMLVVFALPVGAAGPTKQFSLAFNPVNPVVGNNPNQMVRIKNESPNGNSSINSIEFILPTGYTVYAPPVFDPAYGGNIDWTTTSGRVKITNMSPIKRGEFVFLRMPINVTAPTCSSTDWSSTVAWTGSSLTGEVFTRAAATVLPAGYGSAMTAGAVPKLAFGTLPTSFVQSTTTPYSVTVSLTSSCGPVASEASITLAASTSVTGVGTQTTSGGQTTFGLTFNDLGPVTVTASAPSITSILFSSTVFPNGLLACGQQIPPGVTNPLNLAASEPGHAYGYRADFNAKGSLCQLVNYEFRNLILTTDQSIVNSWDITLQPDAAFYYSANWQAKKLLAADAGYPPTTRPKVAWEFDTSVYPPEPIKITDGLACLSNKLPRPYGRVPTGGLGGNVTSITLDVSSPPTGGWESLPAVGTPFPINVGLERMNATVTSGTTLSLVRGQAETSPSTVHAAGAYLMSTPMPIDPRGLSISCAIGPGTSPYCGKAVRMCIVSHGWQAYSPDPVTGDPRYYWVTDAIDNGDGFMSND